MSVFVTPPEIVYSRDQLLDAVWGRETSVMPRTVDVHIQKLRALVEEDPKNPRMILTVRGAGYKFHPDSVRQRIEGSSCIGRKINNR